jgi:hypothetical protein
MVIGQTDGPETSCHTAIGRVDATALLEERADGAARALGGDEDDVDVLWGYDLGVLFVHDGETVREVESLALGDEQRELLPCRRLCGNIASSDLCPFDSIVLPSSATRVGDGGTDGQAGGVQMDGRAADGRTRCRWAGGQAHRRTDCRWMDALQMDGHAADGRMRWHCGWSDGRTDRMDG